MEGLKALPVTLPDWAKAVFPANKIPSAAQTADTSRNCMQTLLISHYSTQHCMRSMRVVQKARDYQAGGARAQARCRAGGRIAKVRRNNGNSWVAADTGTIGGAANRAAAWPVEYRQSWQVS